MSKIILGKTMLTCHETGKVFLAETQGCTVNYARDSQGNTYSDEGVDISEKRELLDRTKPFFGYISSDGKHLTGWKGNVLGTVLSEKGAGYRTENGIRFKMFKYVVRDVHGNVWEGKGEGIGMWCKIKA